MMGRKPANRTDELESLCTDSGSISRFFDRHSSKTREDNNQKDSNYQRLSYGNRIGHSPKSPKRFESPSNHKRPVSITDVINDFHHSYFEAKLHKYFYYHLAKDGSPNRLIRSEFREMISTGCAILTHYYDVLTGEIGFTNDKGHHVRLSYRQLAERLKVSLLRVKRFFRYLKDRGFVRIIEDKKMNENGEWKSNVSRKIVNPAFFIQTLGIDAWKKISCLKEWLIKKAKPRTKREQRNVSMLKNMFSSAASTVTKPKSAPKYQNPDKERDLIRIAMEAYERDPSKPPSEYLKEIRSNLTQKA